VPQHFVEGEVVEGLDELGVGHSQRGDMIRKEFVVVLERVCSLGAITFSLSPACCLAGRSHCVQGPHCLQASHL